MASAITLCLSCLGLAGCPGSGELPDPCDGEGIDCSSLPAWLSIAHVAGQRVYPDEDARPEEGAERVRVTVTCGDDTVVTEGELVPQRDGGSLIDLPDIGLPLEEGRCTVSACLIGPDGACVAYCEEDEQIVEVRPGVDEPVHLDMLCVAPFPGGVNVRVGVVHVRPSAPVYAPAGDIRACGGFTELEFGFETPPPDGVEYRFDLRVSDPIYADRVRIITLPDDRFRIIGLAHGERSDRLSEDGFVPLRATLDVNGATSTYDTHVHVRGEGDCSCRDGDPGLGAPEARGTRGAARCAVDGRWLVLESEALGPLDQVSCRAPLADRLDISGLFGEAADEARLQIEVCNDGPMEEWVTLLLSSAFQGPGAHERASLLLSAAPGACEVHTVGQADFELDPRSTGQFDPADIRRVELARPGAADATRLSVRLDMDCCGDGLCCGPEAVETCDGIDDDCDGAVDEGFDVGGACSSGDGACRRMGRLRCEAGAAVCSAQAAPPALEVCNAQDDDCDGRVDEGVANACGECGAVPREAAVCDGIDNDCDGTIDELCGQGPTIEIRYPASEPLTTILADRFDAAVGMRYAVVQLDALVLDAEDGRLDGPSVVWSTDQDDVQPEHLGHGQTPVVRLYGQGRNGTLHRLTVTATDSHGNTARTAPPRPINIITQR